MSCLLPGTFSQQPVTTCWTWWGISAPSARSRDVMLPQHSSNVLQLYLNWVYICLARSAYFSNKPAPSSGASLPLPSNIKQTKKDQVIVWLCLFHYLWWTDLFIFLCNISDEQLGEAIDEAEADGGGFQPDLEETGVLAVNIGQIMWYKENSISRKPASQVFIELVTETCRRVTDDWHGWRWWRYLCWKLASKLSWIIPIMEVSESPMSLLATELLEQILENLELIHLLNVQLVCKRWAEVKQRIVLQIW